MQSIHECKWKVCILFYCFAIKLLCRHNLPLHDYCSFYLRVYNTFSKLYTFWCSTIQCMHPIILVSKLELSGKSYEWCFYTSFTSQYMPIMFSFMCGGEVKLHETIIFYIHCIVVQSNSPVQWLYTTQIFTYNI